eukprot:SAG31_NODE_40543_length_280_cov_0.745856_1_plen_61_part_10
MVGSHHSIRYDGLELLLTITYSNYRPWSGPGHIHYDYTVRVSTGTKSKVLQVRLLDQQPFD